MWGDFAISEIKTVYLGAHKELKVCFVSSDIHKTEESIKKVLERLLIKKYKEYVVANDK